MMQSMARTGAARKRQEVIKSTHRQRELEWIETHTDEMRRLAAEWVVVEGEDLVAHGKNATVARQVALRCPVRFSQVAMAPSEPTAAGTRRRRVDSSGKFRYEPGGMRRFATQQGRRAGELPTKASRQFAPSDHHPKAAVL